MIISKNYFSLFEMIIVVLVIGFIMGIAAVQMDSVIPTSRLKKQSRETANLMELAISQSAIEGKSLALVFDSDTRTMSLEVHLDEDDDSTFDMTLEELEELILYESVWPESITLNSVEVDRLDDVEVTDERIIFYPEGSSEGGVIVWQEASGYTQTVELWPLLGRVDILPMESAYVY